MVMVCLALSLVRKASQREEMPTPYKLRRADRIFQYRSERSVSLYSVCDLGDSERPLRIHPATGVALGRHVLAAAVIFEA
jgi:hypothetical protein